MSRPVKDIAVLVGSLRKDSVNRKAALALRALAPKELALDIVPIAHLPFYDQDYDADLANTPAAFTEFRQRIAAADGVIFATPEYNRTFPAVLKNAIDIGSRPYGKSVWSSKPAGVISVSMGAMGAFGANQQLRLLLANVNMPTLHQPEVYIGSAEKLFDNDGNVSVEATEAFLRSYMEAFAAWTERLGAPVAPAVAA
jgi:chromate reductase, NAD(P)H dehydrogenase (quinone)